MTLTITSYLSIEQPTLEKVYNVFISQFHAMTVRKLTDAEKDLQIRQLKGQCMLYIIRRVVTDTQNEDELAEIAISWIGRRDTVVEEYLTTAMYVDDREPLGDYEARENAILRKTEELVKRMGILLKVILHWESLLPNEKTEKLSQFLQQLNRTTLSSFMEQLPRHRPRVPQEYGLTPPDGENRITALGDIGRQTDNQRNINQDGGSKYNSRNKKKEAKKIKKKKQKINKKQEKIKTR
tara:strand:+ start:1539 stop:2252 length:714 start_codon:yes stop_codon:yes gene_type:complete